MGIRLKRLHKLPADPSRALTSDLSVPCPSGLEYLPFQKAAVEYASVHSDILIADDPGAGKTIETMGICNFYDDARRILIVCPGFLKPNWRKEFLKWDIKGLSVGIVEGLKGSFPSTTSTSHLIRRRKTR